ncbi:hypothetical protein NM09_04805 [Vibrio caribbeanicus]|uniref:Uncharacterized protein n=1 Tax=Vibrio caribbeanicus TaxID=701175 RepID=A0ACC4P019_9VIBR|nr:NRDE family protein [Vibrio caribbeanicus]KHD26067.1 hypothetical protein NM09_04805 [Vibrio caribbeanicus]
MCTLSWVYHGNTHYEVYFNRDEQRVRLPAIEPQNLIIDGVNCVMPIDPVGGGSWIATNEHGVTICLLNFYQGGTPKGELVSRGMIIKRLASSGSSQMVERRLLEMDLSCFAPFTLVPFDTRRSANESVVWTWNGSTLVRSHATAPIVSAAMHFEQAREFRVTLFDALTGCIERDKLGCQFHHTHDDAAPHLSPLMKRDDARTVSFTSVVVSPNQQTMIYRSFDDDRKIDFQSSLQCRNHDAIQQGVFK